MKTLLILSPHLDDAAFSISPLLAELSASYRIVVATPFAGSVAKPKGFALACQLDKGLPPEIDYMELRRGEDNKWAAAIGIGAVHGNLKEAPHRSYHSASGLFSGIHPDDHIGPELATWLRVTAAGYSPEMILLPLGIGGHVDHLWLRKMTEAIFSGEVPLGYYCDQPYCARQGLVPVEGRLPESDGLEPIKLKPSLPAVERSLEATGAYVSQILFQFGTSEKMCDLLGAAWRESICVFSGIGDRSIVKKIIHVKPN